MRRIAFRGERVLGLRRAVTIRRLTGGGRRGVELRCRRRLGAARRALVLAVGADFVLSVCSCHGTLAVTFSMNSTDEVKINSASLSSVATW